VLIRSDSAGATYGFAAACRTAGVGFSLGAVIDAPIHDTVEVLNTADGWYPAIDSSGATREGTRGRRTHQTGGSVEMVDRHPADPAQGTPASERAAQVHRLRRTPHHRISHRHPDNVVPGQLTGLELRHPQHARVEDYPDPRIIPMSLGCCW
jgi:hypothetical protein